jgi:enamine deaminase RidA (YjgF/YER057c/UK114 family)
MVREAVVPEHWQGFYEATRVPAALRDGDRLYVTGHTGDDAEGNFAPDAEGQIRQTFRKVATTLAAAGAGWDDVVELHSYHVGLQAQADELLAVAAEFLPDPYPVWTALGVTELIDEGAIVEISCVAAMSSSPPSGMS